MKIILKGMARTLLIIGFHEFQLHLVPLIPHSTISKTVLLRSLIFHILTRLENQLLKQRRIILTHFLIRFATGKFFVLYKYIIFFLIIIPTIFSAITEQKEQYGAFNLWSVWSRKYFNRKVEIDEINYFHVVFE